jgi:hypothetical protein
VTEEKTSESEGIISESAARKKRKTSVTEGKLFTDVDGGRTLIMRLGEHLFQQSSRR